MDMTFPVDHTPRFANFVIDGVLDETLREGSERCMFSIATEKKLPLIRKILNAGVKDLIFGSGPNDPSDLAQVLATLQAEEIIHDQKFSFILLLNCFEPLMEQFELFPNDLKKNITISFGMITHDSDNRLFEKTVDAFRELGFESFRVSLLNNFSNSIDERTYEAITANINRTLSLGINTIRINDSLGTLYPEATAVLAANLRNNYPSTSFCLHAHNDRGFGLQNALASIYHGFNLIEGGFAEFGNRSGLPAIELLAKIFSEKSIQISSGNLDETSTFEAARLAEETFLVIPSLFRASSGSLVDCENMGVTNIPDYLGAGSASRYFLNRIGLHKSTLEQIFLKSGLNNTDELEEMTCNFRSELESLMHEVTVRKTFEFQSLARLTDQFYDEDVLFSDRIDALAKDFIRGNRGATVAA